MLERTPVGAVERRACLDASSSISILYMRRQLGHVCMRRIEETDVGRLQAEKVWCNDEALQVKDNPSCNRVGIGWRFKLEQRQKAQISNAQRSCFHYPRNLQRIQNPNPPWSETPLD